MEHNLPTDTSIKNALCKLNALISKSEKTKWLGIIAFATATALFEVLTAMVVVVFAQVLNKSDVGQEYLKKFGLDHIFSNENFIFYLAIIFGLVYLLKNIVAASEVFYQNFTIQKMHYHFKNKLLARYSEMDYGFYLTRNASYGVEVIANDAGQMFTIGMIAIASIVTELILLVFLVSMIVYMNVYLALVIFTVGGIFTYCVIKLLFPRFYVWGQGVIDAGFQSRKNLLQFFYAFKEMILLGKRDNFIDKYKHYSYKSAQLESRQIATNALPRMVIELIFVGLFVLSIIIMWLENESPIHIIGTLGGYLYTGFRVMPGLNRMIHNLNNFKAIIPSINRIYREQTEVFTENQYNNISDFSFEKSIKFNNVDFNYLNTNKKALDNISLTIAKGECIGIVGETGSGKSTFIDLVFGLLLPTKGTITIDDKNPVNSYQWHSIIGYVPQSLYLIDDSIAVNIAFSDTKIDKERLEYAIDAAQLRRLIDKLPEGAETVVGDRGVRLSGGERQRIAIARALYKEPQVLIFDEATSALDNATEAKLMQTINSVSQDHTVLMIAHRLTTLRNCDRIIRIHDGKVVQITNYDELQKEVI